MSLDIIYSEDSGDEYVPEKISKFHVSDSDESFMCLENNQHESETSTIIVNHNDYMVSFCTLIIIFYCMNLPITFLL